MLNLDYRGKVVTITGAASGISRATALAFAVNGAAIVIGDVSDGGAETAEMIKAKGGDALFVKTDVSDAASVQAFIDAALDRHGRIDAAFNNAGVLPPTGAFADVEEKDFDRVLAVDLKGVFLPMRAQIRAMLKSGGGAIVNTASVAGLVADPGMAPYVAAKHGVIGLTKAAALDHAADNIRVNAIAPGLIATPMTERWLADPAFKDRLLANSPMGRAAQPDEIAGTVLYLCSPLASFTTGATFPIDGAQTAH